MLGPRPAPGRPRSAKREGAFTLIEVLAVVAITGIVLAVAIVNLLPSDAQVSRRDAGALALEVEDARDSAWFGGLPTAVSFAEGRLQRWRLAGNGWRREEAKQARLDSEVRIRALHVDGEALPAGERLVFMPDGLGTPFRVALEVRGIAWAIEGDAAGSVRLVER